MWNICSYKIIDIHIWGVYRVYKSNTRTVVTSRRCRGQRQDHIFTPWGVLTVVFCLGRCPGRCNMRRGKMKRDRVFVLRVNATDQQMLSALAGTIGRSRGATVRMLVRAGAAALAAAAVARRAIQQQGAGHVD
mgnify:CR=1 FL=1